MQLTHSYALLYTYSVEFSTMSVFREVFKVMGKTIVTHPSYFVRINDQVFTNFFELSSFISSQTFTQEEA